MPNKPWLIDRVLSFTKVSQILLWIIFRTFHRIFNAFPIEINIKNRIINHKYFQNSKNWGSVTGDHLFGYFGNLIDADGIKSESKQIIETRPSDFPIFFDRPTMAEGVFYAYTHNNPYNYYHFLYDFICPLFIYRNSNPDAQIYLPFDPAKWQFEWLNIIGQTKVLHARLNGNFSASKINRFENFVDSKNQIQRTQDFIFFKNYVQKTINQTQGDIKKYIYIVRKNSSMGRNIVNQKEIITNLVRLGFAIVDLDRMSVQMQLKVFQNAQLIVSPHDAGLSNLVAAKSGTKILELLPMQTDGIYDIYKKICQLTKISYSNITSTQYASYKPGSNFKIELSQILDVIKNT